MRLNKVVLDIPHGGKKLPPEVKEHLHPDFSRGDALREADLYSQGIYRQQAGVPDANKIWFDYLRAIVDTNRDPDDFSNDGIIKTKTSHGSPIYKYGMAGLPYELKQHLVEKYAVPYQGNLHKAIEKPDTRLVVLCHTMDPVGPIAGVGAGKKRPLINIANGGDWLGNPHPNKPYLPQRDIMEFVRGAIEEKTGTLNLKGVISDGNAVGMNRPFAAKKAIDRLGKERLRDKKVLLIEVNKSIIMDAKTLAELRPENIAAVREIVHEIIEGVLTRLTR